MEGPDWRTVQRVASRLRHPLWPPTPAMTGIFVPTDQLSGYVAGVPYRREQMPPILPLRRYSQRIQEISDRSFRVEPLERRRLLAASISGMVFYDFNGSGSN